MDHSSAFSTTDAEDQEFISAAIDVEIDHAVERLMPSFDDYLMSVRLLEQERQIQYLLDRVHKDERAICILKRRIDDLECAQLWREEEHSDATTTCDEVIDLTNE